MPAPSVTTPKLASERLEFIEATRGIAALLVLALHSIESFLPELAPATHRVIDPGTVGVIAFFFVSGFVIPMTLERSQSQSRFWINRICRIYPLYGTVFALAVVLGLCHVQPYATGVAQGLGNLLPRHVVIVQGFTGGVDMVNGSWTLLIEMIFYAAFSIAFALGLNRRPLLMLAMIGGLVLAGTAVGIVLHKRIPLGRPVLLLAAFNGFVFFRHWQGVVSTRALAVATAAAMAVASFAYWEMFGFFVHHDITLFCALASLYGALVLFVGAYALRKLFTRARGPSVFIGSLTYSVYLLHPLVIAVLVQRFGAVRWGLVAVPLLCIPLAMLTYRLVEKPGIELGRRLGRRAPSALATEQI